MKKIIFLALFTNAIMASSFEAGLGYVPGDKNGDMVTGFFGMKVISLIGLRMEYTKNISKNSDFSTQDVTRYGLFATYTLPLVKSISITPKAGIVKTDSKIDLGDAFDAITNDNTSFTYGLELNYAINNQIDIFAGYTDYTKDISNIDKSNFLFGLKIAI